MQPTQLEAGDSSRRGSSHTDECDPDENDILVAASGHSFYYFETKKMKPGEDFEWRKKDMEGGERSKEEADVSTPINFTVEVDVEPTIMTEETRGMICKHEALVSLSDDLANIGHIDSSETSDDSPEGEIHIS